MNAARSLLVGLLLSPGALMAQTIVAAEYFVDADPGVGNGTAIAVTPGDSTTTSFSMLMGALPAGMHTISVRHRSDLGRWSHALAKPFYAYAASFTNPPTAGITAAEYFFDTDPGVGNGTAFALTPGDSTTTTFLVDASLLTPGFHRVCVRHKNGDGLWSHMLTRSLFIYDTGFLNPVGGPVVAAEYFINTDPGVGNGTAFAIVPGDSTSTTFVVDVSALPVGFHRVCVRQKNVEGRWSHMLTRSLYIIDTGFINPPGGPVVAAEYFIDADPGVGNGVAFAIAPGDSTNTTFTVDLSALAPGFHSVCVRQKNAEGRWSHAVAKHVYVFPAGFNNPSNAPLVAGEYFFDTDPGHGNGTAIAVTPDDSVTYSVAGVDLSGLDPGFHYFCVRFRDAQGKWGQIRPNPIHVYPNAALASDVVAGEYFIDTDPGQGFGTAFSTGAPADSIDVNALFDTSLLPPGTHRIGVRTRDDLGRWSHAEARTITVEDAGSAYRTINSGDWADPLIWERYNGSSWVPTGAAPSHVSGTITVRNGHAVAVSLATSMDEVLVESGGSITIAATATVMDGVGFDVDVLGALTLANGGLLTGTGTVRIVHQFFWTGGATASGLTISIESTGSSTVNCGCTLIHGGIIQNAGTWTVINGDLHGTGEFTNLAGGVLSIQGAYDINNAWGIALYNGGSVQVNVALHYTFFTSVFVNLGGGTVTVSGGELWMNGFVNGGGVICSGGLIRIVGGSFVHNAGGYLTNGYIIVNGGTLVANTSLTILNLYVLSGTVSGTGGIQVIGGGTLACTGGTIAAGCVIDIAATASVNFNAATVFYNYGTINLGGTWSHLSGSLHGNGTVTVLSTAVVTITGVWDPYDSWQNALVCHGAINVNVPIAFAFTGQVDLEVTGTVTVVNGVLWTYGFNNGGNLVCLGSSVLRISGGVFVHEVGGSTSTAGIILAGGTLIAQAPLDILHFWLEGGTLQGPQPVNVITGGTFTWTGGTIHASCVLNLAVGVVSVFNTTVSVYCYGAIYNGGTWSFNGGNLIGGGAFHNLATGAFTINGVLDIDLSWELVFYNAGIVNKGTALVFTHYGGAFHNLTGGLVNVLAGEYRFKGGYFNHGSIVTTGLAELCGCGGTFTNENGGEATNGRVVIRDGSLVVNWAFNVKHFKLDTGGQVFGPFELNVVDGGTFVWIGGTIEASAIVDLAINVITTFNPVASVFCHGVIHHRGTWNFNGGDLKGDGTFHNYIGAIVYIYGVLDVDLSWRLLVYNAGEFRKMNGGIFTHYATYFHNLAGGLVHIVDGEYRFKGGFYNYGSITYAGLGKLCGCGGTFTNESGGEASNGRVVIRNASLVVNWAFDVKHFELEDGAQVFGPLEVKVINGGTFKWIGGTIEASAIIDIAINVITTFNPVASVFCHGVIHHRGTWNFNGGDLKGDGTFHNYLGAIVYIYGVFDVDLSWRLLVYNAGEFRKMNGGIFTHYATFFHNLAGGLVHIVDGEYRFKGGFYNYGSITYAGLGKLCGCGGTFYNENGGEASNGRVVIRNASLVVNWAFDVKHFELEDGAQVFGPLEVKVIDGGTFKWIGGTIEASAIIDIAINVITTFNPVASVFCHGVIHHRGTWNFEGGKLWGNGVFNNLSAGLILITGTSDPADSWRVALNNAGIYRMNCGCAFRHAFGTFTNLVGGKLEVLQGTLLLDGVFTGDQYGEILVSLGAALNLTLAVDWRGTKAICHGLLQCPDFRFKGVVAQEMGGDGTFTHIRIDNGAGVDLSGHVKVSITIILVNGHVRCGDYHITLENALAGALVGGSVTSRFVCDGLGSFRRAINGIGCFYPVGTSTKYCPITLGLMSGPQDICGVRVRPTVNTSYGAVGVETGTTVSSHAVGCTWVLDEATSGGNSFDASLQWDSIDALAAFTPGNCTVAHYTIGGWVTGGYGPASGTDPYTKVIYGLIDPREICVADPLADLGGDAVDCLGVPGGNDLPGTPCDDGDSGTTDDTWTAECDCAGTPVVACTTDLDFVYQADGAHSLTWTIHEQGTNTPVQSGGGMLVGNGSEQTCVPDGCYYLVVTDGGGDGIVGGGYLLKVNSAARLIDNLYGAFGEGGFTSGSTSQIDGNEGFCIPVGTDRLIFTSCDKRDWRLSPCGGEYMVTTDNAAVSAEYGGPNAATSGYQMWWFKPNGGYSFKRFQSHATGNGMPASATRACHFKLNAWAGNALQEGGFYNVKVRGRVNGAYNAWGPACRMVVSSAEAQCPRTKLMDIPGNAYLSCGQMRDVGTNVFVHARPVKRMNAACSWVNANRYQFRFRIASENITIVKTGALGAGNYFVNTNGLVCGKTYEVEVRASFDGGSTWCHGNADPNVTGPLWGDACLLTITCGSGMAQEEDVATALSEARMVMYPNPNRGDQLFLGLSGLERGVGSVNVDIFDSFGKRVAQHTFGVKDGFVSTAIDLNGELSNGMYMVSIAVGDAILIERLVVQK